MFFFIPDSLRRHVPAAAYDRGLLLFRGRKVLACSLELVSERRWSIEGEVQGTQFEPYEVQLTVQLDGRGGVAQFASDCTCPVGADCKHGVALVLQAAAQQGVNALQGGAVPQRAPDPGLHAAQEVAHWLDRLDELAPAAEAAVHSLQAGEEYPLYLLRHQRVRGGTEQLALHWRVARWGQRGGWNKSRSPGYSTVYTLESLRQAGPDRDCVRAIEALAGGHAGHGSSADCMLQGAIGRLLLQTAASTGRLFLCDDVGQMVGAPLYWEEGRSLDWRWQEQPAVAGKAPALWRLQPRLHSAADAAPAPRTGALGWAQPFFIHAGPPALFVDGVQGCCGTLALPDGLNAGQLALLLAAPPMPANSFHDSQGRLLQRMAPLSLPPQVQAPEPWPQVPPRAVLQLALAPAEERRRHGLVVAVLRFDYAGLRGWWSQPGAQVVMPRPGGDGPPVLLTRDLSAEAAACAQLQLLGLQAQGQGGFGRPDTRCWLDWALQDWQPLRAAGFVLELDPLLAQWVQQVDDIEVQMQVQDGEWAALTPDAQPAWFDLSLGIYLNGERQDILPWLPDWLAQVEPGPDGPQLPDWLWREQADGRWLRLPSAPLKPWLRALLELVGERELQALQAGHLRLSRLEALRTAAALGEGAQWQGAEQLRALVGQLAAAGQLPEVAPPTGLQAELRPYQRQGMAWLQFLRQHQLGGVLADDMGLGKTLQTLAHLLCEQEAGRLDRPCLVIAPVSLLGNWRREAERFAPSLRTRIWHGLERHSGDFVQDCDLLIAPYSLLQRDRERWLAQRWHVLVLDEAQHIKNASTQAAQVVAQIDARQRLALSGTPLENHLGELWSLFHFLMPGFLGSQRRFGELFRQPIEKQGDSEALLRLRQRVTPFMLRRTKVLVATELPPCIESVTSVELDGVQADLYETIRLATEKSVRDALADKGLARSQIQVLDALLKLRQVCCDPRLVKTSAAAKARHSAKLELLMELLTEMLAEGRRVLLFSQFTSMLTLIEERLQAAGLAWTKLTGQTQKREAAIARFTSGEVPLFLISLKAGGTGLNLPQADTVIHYDPWWNPAVEAQATGRAHRIGQENQVMVYKLVASGTIEERILALQERKAALAAGLLAGATGRGQPLFTENDLAELLRPLGS
ncbi:DEAD/DEAH box helicase family protein [Acidovorax sp. HDW3]|uniref:DEAD/DEAH box helicase n=1 Tax=Acidovorax sp. HDW3 TaxID=2714923 RepID=UPI00140C1FC4|nr:DEAD/DEAH box helicase [Acidovorax sp. HDW3]QIL44392.1 DEAD/DEAH box helicase family protein [Acidovorax sp. HDW3]